MSGAARASGRGAQLERCEEKPTSPLGRVFVTVRPFEETVW